MLIHLPEISTWSQFTHPAMGTVMSHKLFGSHTDECQTAVVEETDHLEILLSCFLPDSDISRINRYSGQGKATIAPETLEILVETLNFSQISSGCYDPTIGPLVTLWKDSRITGCPPDRQEIGRVLCLVNHNDLVLDPITGSAALKRKGQSIDLGGIGKGYAADRILEIFREYGISSAYSNLGGNVITLGSKPDGSAWRIGIQHPRQPDQLIGSVGVVDRTVVTSGDYQRFFTDNQGKRHHHILNPSTGYPAESGLSSVTVISNCSVTADALSTILFIAGLENGLSLLHKYPGNEAVFVTENLQVYVTSGLEGSFLPAPGIKYSVFKKMDGRNEKKEK